MARRAAFAGLALIGVMVSPIVIQQAIGVDVARQGDLLATTNTLARSFDHGGSTLEVPDLNTSGEVARFVPLGVFTVLFRPFPGEVPHVFGALAGIENVFLLLLVVRAAWRTKLREFREPLVAWALLTVLLWAVVYAFNSFQNLGTATRHRLEIEPLLLGLLFYLGRRRGHPATVTFRSRLTGTS
jgi:hypothetical protein